MKNKLIYMLLTCLLFSSLSFSQNPKNHRYILFDITGSMAGLGNDVNGVKHKNIWDEAIDLLEKQLNSFSNGDIVSLYLFGSNIYDKGTVTITDEKSLNSLLESVHDIRRNNEFETCTCTYYALNAVFEELSKENSNIVYLFTDGNHTAGCDPHCDSVNALEALNKFDSRRSESDRLFIYELKPGIELDLGEGPVTSTDDAFKELTVVIDPFNRNLLFNKDVLSSNQKFVLTGTGVNELEGAGNINIKISDLELTAKNAINQNVDISPGINLLNSNIHNITLNPMNDISTFDSKVYKGKITYSFEDNTSSKTIEFGNYKINLVISPNSSIVTMDNSREKPKVIIKFNK